MLPMRLLLKTLHLLLKTGRNCRQFVFLLHCLAGSFVDFFSNALGP